MLYNVYGLTRHSQHQKMQSHVSLSLALQTYSELFKEKRQPLLCPVKSITVDKLTYQGMANSYSETF